MKRREEKMKSNLAILWDIENVTPSSDSMFVEGLLDYARQLGNVSAAIAIGNWTPRSRTSWRSTSRKRVRADPSPQHDEQTKTATRTVSDFVLIAKAPR
jgi:hypothetical protein